MRKFILELRRREVFRSAGLYIGICWILIEGASVVLPAFDAPDVIVRFMIIATIVGFPIMLVLAWVYDISSKGVVVQPDATDTVVLPFGSRKGDLIVIGVLSVALVFAVYLNVTGRSDVSETIDPFSVLIADFDNDTGDALFDGSLEQGLQIGIEGASFISVYERGLAQKVATELRDTDKLDSVTAQLVAAREGIKLVLVGSIAPRGKKFDLSVKAIVPTRGEIVAEADATANGKLAVLTAIGELAADLREELGDKSVDRKALKIDETFTAMSLEAARDYDTAQRLQYDGNYEKAIEHYRAAVEHDPKFGRAYSGWAVAARALGRLDEANAAWEQTMANLGSMTERERLRTQGMYYWGVTRNFQKAIETFEKLVEKYPADHVGHNNLAVQYLLALDFENARREGRLTVEIYPKNVVARSNFALYAMYSGDFELAATEAKQVRELDATWFKAWLPIAMQALSVGDFDTARAAYNSMAETSGRGASTASLGLADIELLTGNFGAAQKILEAGIPVDEANGNNYGLAVKYMALAEALLAQGDSAAALEAVESGVGLTGSNAALVPAALLYVAAGTPDKALAISETLSQKLPPQPRAYAALIEALVAREAGNHVQAIEQLTGALEIADLWLLRFHLGRAYFEAGYFVEAVDEFTAAQQRHGEATALFLDDLPTYHHAATLPYWLGRAQAELGMTENAAENFALFLKLRPAGGPLTDDARQRLP
ncbi:MAG: tetratricopeptide repeat protein [Gammaproteobacteria bacterium]|nr:tetratricopeptide repeat protein [Gammaproteobacteria bacterium]